MSLTRLAFGELSDQVTVPGGAYNVKVTPANNAGVIVIDANVTLDAGKRYSVYATGPLATAAPALTNVPFRLILLDDFVP